MARKIDALPNQLKDTADIYANQPRAILIGYKEEFKVLAEQWLHPNHIINVICDKDAL